MRAMVDDKGENRINQARVFWRAFIEKKRYPFDILGYDLRGISDATFDRPGITHILWLKSGRDCTPGEFD